MFYELISLILAVGAHAGDISHRRETTDTCVCSLRGLPWRSAKMPFWPGHPCRQCSRDPCRGMRQPRPSRREAKETAGLQVEGAPMDGGLSEAPSQSPS